VQNVPALQAAARAKPQAGSSCGQETTASSKERAATENTNLSHINIIVGWRLTEEKKALQA
jgi:hypothetical protein